MKLRRTATVFFALTVLAFSAGEALANRSAATGTPVSTAGDVQALLLGIGDFAPEGAGGPDLALPDEDVADVSDVLENVYGISGGNIDTIVTTVEVGSDVGDASRANILAAINSLKTATGPSDDLFLYVSGHGTRVFDDGTGDGDNERVDNAILTSDLDVIRDGELAALLAGDNAARVIVVLDISFPSGFIDDFQAAFADGAAPELLLIAAAKGEAAESGALDNGIFTYWFFNQANAVPGLLPGPAFANDDGDAFLNADDQDQNPHADQDGDVSLEEAFDFASHVRARSLSQKPNVLDLATNDVLLD